MMTTSFVRTIHRHFEFGAQLIQAESTLLYTAIVYALRLILFLSFSTNREMSCIVVHNTVHVT